MEGDVLALPALDGSAADVTDVHQTAGALAQRLAQPVTVEVGTAEGLGGGGDGRYDGARVEPALYEGQQRRVRAGLPQDRAERGVGAEAGHAGIQDENHGVRFRVFTGRGGACPS